MERITSWARRPWPRWTTRGLALVVLVGAGERLDVPPAPEPVLSTLEAYEAPSRQDFELLRRLGQGIDAERNHTESQARIKEDPRQCTPQSAAVEAARQAGKLEEHRDWLQQRLKDRPGDPFLVFGLANTFEALQSYTKARSLYGVAVRDGIPCWPAYNSFLYLSRRVGKLNEARNALEQWKPRSGRSPHRLLALAVIEEMRGDHLAASFAYRRALLQAPPLSVTYLGHADVMANIGEFENAARSVRLGLKRARRFGLPTVEIIGVARLASLLGFLDQTEESKRLFDEGLETSRRYGFRYLEAGVFLDRANQSASRGDVSGWQQDGQLAADLLATHWKRMDKNVLLLDLARTSISLGEPHKAAALFETVKQLATEDGDPFAGMDARLGFVDLWTSAGKVEQATALSNEVLELAATLEDGRRQGRAISSLATLFERTGSYLQALEHYRQALGWAEREGNLHLQALATSNLSIVHLRLGLPAPAILYGQRALRMAEVFGDVRLEAGVQQSLAAGFAGLRDYARAEQIYAKAIAAAQKLPRSEMQALVLAGRARILLARGDTLRAQADFVQALEVARSQGNRLLELQALSGLGLAYWQQGQLDKAVSVLRQSVQLVESSRQALLNETQRLRYLETRSSVYANLSAIMTELDRTRPGQGHRERAFGVVEQARARSLLDILATTGAEQQEANLGSGRPLPVDRIRNSVLGKDELLLEYELGERRSTLWILSRNEFRWLPLPPRPEIENKVRQYLRTIRFPPRYPRNPFTRHRALSRELYGMLLSPVEKELDQTKNVVISPSGILHHLPFEALLRPDSETPGEEKYLVEEFSLTYVPSASVLASLRSRAGQKKRPPLPFLGFAQPSPRIRMSAASADTLRLGAIPYASREVESLGALFSDRGGRIYLQRDTNERMVKDQALDQYGIIHFAAHAMADERAPQRSSILLGIDPEDTEDGVLQMREVLDLTLNADLVVLSGCQTGLGQLLRAEGTLGFTWAFLSAGSSAVAVSLWNVNDRSTSLMMRSFYEAMLEGEEPSQALATSKRAMLRSGRRAYHHPYFWAPFVLVGRPQASI